MKRREFLACAAAAPIAALAVWRPPAPGLAPEEFNGLVGVDYGAGPSWCVFCVWGSWGVEQLQFPLPADVRFTQVAFREVDAPDGARAVVRARRLDGVWWDIAALTIPRGDLYQVRLDELHPIRRSREVVVFSSSGRTSLWYTAPRGARFLRA